MSFLGSKPIPLNVSKHAIVLISLISIVDCVGSAHAWNMERVDVHFMESHADKNVLLLLLGLRIGIEEIVEDVFECFDLVNRPFLLLFASPGLVFLDG